MKRLVYGFAVIAAVLLGTQAPAFAHNSLVEAIPAKDAALTEAPPVVSLRFLETLEPSTKLTVAGPDGASVIGTPAINGKIISASFTGKASGKYTVHYEVTADDGDVTKADYVFTLSLPEPVKVTESAAPVTTTAAATAPAAAAETKSSSTSWAPWIIGAAIAGLVVGAAIAFARRRRAS